MTKKILIATHNEHKVEEFRRICPTFEFISLKQLNDNEDFIETGQTFEENSFLKANHFFEKYRLITIADDSGLEVISLNNQPGINSKRYSGGDDYQNNLKLLEELKDSNNRTASFRCVLTLFEDENEITQFEGIMTGEIAHELRGSEGFGYDPLFLIPSENKTLAELGPKYKDKHSHRAKALLLLKEHLDENISN